MTSVILNDKEIDQSIKIKYDNIGINLKVPSNSILTINDDLPFLPRQNLPNAYLPNGAIYIAKANHFLKQRSFFSKKMALYEMDEKSSLDIDTKKDLITANILVKKQNSF